MLGSLDPNGRDVVVVGGGIAGLLAAYSLDRMGFEVTLLERKERLGGLIETRRTSTGMAEAAANSILATAQVKRLCQELKVELCPVERSARRRFILRNGKPSVFPLGLKEASTLVWRALFEKSQAGEPDSLDEWALRHIGAVGLNYLINPMVRGIYGASPSELSVKAAFPKLHVPVGRSLLQGFLIGRRKAKASHDQRDLRHGRAAMMAPRFGMGSLAAELESYLRRRLGNRLKTGCAVGGKLPKASNIVLCVPAYEAAALLRDNHCDTLAEALEGVGYAPLISATVVYPRDSVSAIRPGVGVLFPTVEETECLGILYSSDCFPGRVSRDSEWRSFTVMLGGTEKPGALDLSDESILSAIARDMKRVFGVNSPPIDATIFRWPRAIPIYSKELHSAWITAEASWCARPGRILFGNYTGQVSVRGLIEEMDSLRKSPLPCPRQRAHWLH